MTSRLIFAVVLASCYLGCASRNQESPGSTVISPGLEFAIPPGHQLGYSVDANQLIIAHFRDKVEVFQAYVSVSPEKVIFVAFDPSGGRAMTINSNNDGIYSQAAPIVPSVLRPENILADIAIVYWPAPAVKRGLAGSGASFFDNSSQRTIEFGGRRVVQVDYGGPHDNAWPKVAHLRNIEYGYQLDLQSTVTADEAQSERSGHSQSAR